MKRFITVLLFLISFSSATAWAGYSVDPGSVKIMGKQGETREGSFLVTNAGDKAVKIKVEAENWHVRFLGLDGALDDVYQWLALDTREFEMPARSQGDYTFKVNIPKELKEEEMAQLYFSFTDLDSENKQAPPAAMNIEQRIGVLVTMAAEETAKHKGMITKVEVHPVWKKDGTMGIRGMVSIANRGNVHTKPSGKVKIFKNKTLVDEKPVGNDKSIFKNSSETFYFEFENVNWEPGKYKAKVLIGLKSYDFWENLEEDAEFTITEKPNEN